MNLTTTTATTTMMTEINLDFVILKEYYNVICRVRQSKQKNKHFLFACRRGLYLNNTTVKF